MGRFQTGQYVAGVYWAFTTMTTVGYGDILPQNDIERAFAILIMFTGTTALPPHTHSFPLGMVGVALVLHLRTEHDTAGATVFGYIVGSVSTLANDPNGTTAKTNRYLKKVRHARRTSSQTVRFLCFVLI